MVNTDVNHALQIMNVLLVKLCLIVQRFSTLQLQLVTVNSAQMAKTVDR